MEIFLKTSRAVRVWLRWTLSSKDTSRRESGGAREGLSNWSHWDLYKNQAVKEKKQRESTKYSETVEFTHKTKPCFPGHSLREVHCVYSLLWQNACHSLDRGAIDFGLWLQFFTVHAWEQSLWQPERAKAQRRDGLRQLTCSIFFLVSSNLVPISWVTLYVLRKPPLFHLVPLAYPFIDTVRGVCY